MQQISADAASSGDGGKVIVWADEVTCYHGTHQCDGWRSGGNGGLVEVSGKQNLAFNGFSRCRPHRSVMSAAILLDPNNITIQIAACRRR